MRINEVEAIVGITKKNIRFYEEKGLLSPRRSSENGYRDYGEAEVQTLKQIKLMRKLGVPIEDIRKMLEGGQTVGDGMRRHLVTLERERQNIDEAMRLCTLLKERQERLSELNPEQVLDEMEQLEHTGTTFQNKQKQDARYVAPVTITVLLSAMMAFVMGVIVWGVCLMSEDVPLVLVLFLLALPLLIIGGVLLALRQRIQEIEKGEADDAKQY